MTRGERECLQLLADLATGSMGFAAPSREWLSKRLGCPLRTLDRWTAELRKAGLIQVKQRQHHAAVYTVQPCQNGKAGGEANGKAERRYIGRVKLSESERLQPKGMGTATWAQSRGNPVLEWAYVHNYPVRTEAELREAETAMERWLKESVA